MTKAAITTCGPATTRLLLASTSVLALTVAQPASAQIVSIDGGQTVTVPSGAYPSPWDISGWLRVGENGNGTLIVEDGGVMSSIQVHLGFYSGSAGTATITGSGSSLTTSGYFMVGDSGMGTLRIENGADVTAGYVAAGVNQSGASGTITVTGPGSSLAASSDIGLGHLGTGSLTISNGGLATAPVVSMGSHSSGTGGGFLTLEGAEAARGVLETGWIERGPGSASIAFDGGVLRAAANQADFLQNFSAGDVTIEAGGAFIDSNGFDIGIATPLQGAGGLTKLGAGTLTLSGVNLYAGGTTVEEGILRAGASDAFVNGAAYTVNGGVLDLGGFDLTMSSLSGAGGEVDLNSAFLRIDQAGDTVFDGDITGNGRFHKNGGGTLTLNGAIGLSSGLYVEGGTLILNGENNYAGGTNLYNVVLEVGNDKALSGGQVRLRGSNAVLRANADVALANEFQFELTSGTLTIAGVNDIALTGDLRAPDPSGSPGGIIKTGMGTLTLSGMNSYVGDTIVNGGALLVEGSIASSALTTVNAGAVLGGSGIVGDTTIASGGVHAPGSSIGVQTIDGDYADHGALEIEATPVSADQVKVNGTVDIAGATLDLILSPANAAGWNINNGPFIIIDNDGGDAIAGRFDPVTRNLLFLDESLDYFGGDGNDVALALTRNSADFSSVAGTRNQRAVAGGIESLGSGNAIHDVIAVGSDGDLVRASFDQLSGEIHASTKTALIADSRFVRGAIEGRIRAASEGVGAIATPVLAFGEGGPVLAPADTDRFAAWGNAFGSWGSFDGDGNAAGLDSSTGGFLTGFDGIIAETWRIGLMAGYSQSSFDADDRASSGSSDNYHLGLYGGTQRDFLALRSGLAYTWSEVETSRSVAIPGFTDGLSGAYDAGAFQAFGEVGYRVDTIVAAFEPFANLAYVNLHADGFTEDGGAAALSSQSQTTDTIFTTLGQRAATSFTMGTIDATARGMLGWRHAFGDTTPLSTHAFAGGDAFTVAGAPIASDAALVEVGLDLDLTDRATLGISYQGQFGDGARRHGVNAKLAVKF